MAMDVSVISELSSGKSLHMNQDKEVFLEVLEHHKKIIFKVCNAYCYDAEDRKDLAQEVIIQLWKSYPRYDARFKISTWMYRIALNVAISFYRKEKSRSTKKVSWEDSFLWIADTQDEDNKEELTLLHQFIDQLDSFNRALMILYLDDHTYEEIAKVMDISVTNVGTKLNRIKQKLKKQFETLEK